MQLRSIIIRIAVAFAAVAACVAVAGTGKCGSQLDGGGQRPALPQSPNYAPKLECYIDMVKGADGYWHSVKVSKP